MGHRRIIQRNNNPQGQETRVALGMYVGNEGMILIGHRHASQATERLQCVEVVVADKNPDRPRPWLEKK